MAITVDSSQWTGERDDTPLPVPVFGLLAPDAEARAEAALRETGGDGSWRWRQGQGRAAISRAQAPVIGTPRRCRVRSWPRHRLGRHAGRRLVAAALPRSIATS